jgi:glutaconate CoA-transferase subunit A
VTKITSLAAAAAMIPHGATIAIGGFGVAGHPMALLRELVRQRVGGLTVQGFTSGLDVDLLAAAGLVATVESSAVSLESFGMAMHYRRASEAGQLRTREYTESMMFHRFWAGANGLSFMHTRVALGTDILKWNPDLRPMECPLTGDAYVAMPPARPRLALLHVPYADELGNAAVPRGGNFTEVDRLMASAAESVILTCERIVTRGQLQAMPPPIFVPGFRVAAVVEAPMGAHPGACGDYYTNDDEHLAAYAAASRDPAAFAAYRDRFVDGYATHTAYLERIGTERLFALRTGDGVAPL